MRETRGCIRDAEATWRVRDMPMRLRPREEMERLGVEHVTDQVLLAILLRSGTRGQSVVELAARILRTYGSLTALSRATTDELARHSELQGLGRVKAQVLLAALELARRLAQEERGAAVVVRTPADAANLLRETARPLEKERFWVLLLDTRNRLKREPQDVTEGILDASLVHPREVFRSAIQVASAAVVLVHNHPSGDPTPSAEDVRITRQMAQAGEVLGIRVLDHVILGGGAGSSQTDFVSLRESGMVDFGR